jgi:hypothetical protein
MDRRPLCVEQLCPAVRAIGQAKHLSCGLGAADAGVRALEFRHCDCAAAAFAEGRLSSRLFLNLASRDPVDND